MSDPTRIPSTSSPQPHSAFCAGGRKNQDADPSLEKEGSVVPAEGTDRSLDNGMGSVDNTLLQACPA